MTDIIPADKAHLADILKINNEAVPKVNALENEDLEYFLESARAFYVMMWKDQVAGFAIILGPGLDYESPNYRAFQNRYADFDYVDRIVVHALHRGKGWGQMLYEKVFEQASSDIITCEVNIKPPNTGSMRFHKSMGFMEIGRQKNSSAGKEVALLVKEM